VSRANFETRVSRLYGRRKFANKVFVVLSTSAALFGLVWLALILSNLLYEGISAISPALFTEITPPPGEAGGLANALVGSLIMIGLATFIGTPIGILAGTYLAEYGRHTRLSQLIRMLNDILLSAPSIVIGLFVYEVLVITMGHFSGIAGAFALAVIVIPVVVRTTENMLLLVPNALREAASALGAPSAFVIRQVTWRSAQAGIITGVLLAVARISGETAPLLFTALNNQFWSTDLNAPMASLPVIIFQFALSPYENWHVIAWGGAILITVAVLTLSIIARFVGTSSERR
jgi:phosphate transport system permease protein